jgi:hypothetical protein
LAAAILLPAGGDVINRIRSSRCALSMRSLARRLYTVYPFESAPAGGEKGSVGRLVDNMSDNVRTPTPPNHDFSPRSDPAGRAGLQPRRSWGPSGLSVPFPEQLAAASCSGNGT